MPETMPVADSVKAVSTGMVLLKAVAELVTLIELDEPDDPIEPPTENRVDPSAPIILNGT